LQFVLLLTSKPTRGTDLLILRDGVSWDDGQGTWNDRLPDSTPFSDESDDVKEGFVLGTFRGGLYLELRG